jgi:hypothetical protein
MAARWATVPIRKAARQVRFVAACSRRGRTLLLTVGAARAGPFPRKRLFQLRQFSPKLKRFPPKHQYRLAARFRAVMVFE